MKNTTKIGIVLAISLTFFAAEIAIGFKTKSLALIADAFHYLNDIVAYFIAFVAAYLHERGQHTHSFTYAFHRAELVGAFFNGVFLLALALSIFLQSIERFVHVEEVNSPKLVIIIGAIGLALNIVSVIVVHDHGHGHSHGDGHKTGTSTPLGTDALQTPTAMDIVHATHNHRVDPPAPSNERNLGLVGVFIHVFGDAVNNIGVVIAGVIILTLSSPQRFYADPAVSLAIALIIFGSAIPMTRQSGRILLEASPVHLDLAKIKEDLLSVPDVLSVHDLHVWHLSQSVILGSLHVCVPNGTTLEKWERTERYLQHCFEEYGIKHVTISPEIYRDYSLPVTDASSIDEAGMASGCRLPSEDGFGCAVSMSAELLKKRRVAVQVNAA